MDQNILECKDLSKHYINTKALDCINLRLSPGKIVGLLGPNGSGKTTLIKTINGLLQPSSGEVFIDGMKPGIETKKIISYLPDQCYLNDHMKVRNLIQMFTDFYGDFDRDRANELMEKFNINLDDKLSMLSKGTREKVQLMMVMSRKAKLFLLDEPIGGVDPATRDYILEDIIKSKREDSTVLISTHLIADVEKILDEVVFIKNGNILFHENARKLREREGTSIEDYFKEVFRC